MIFYIYNLEQAEQKFHHNEWSMTPLRDEFKGTKPTLNNSFHPIGDISLLKKTNDPDVANYFLVPYLLRHTHHLKSDESLHNFLADQFNFFSKYPQKHIFFIGSDDNREVTCLRQSIKFALSCNKASKDLSLYYQPNVKPPCKITPINLAHFDVSFQGYVCNDLRKKMAKIILSCDMKRTVINTRYWFEKFMQNDTTEMERDYSGLIHMSKFILCPRGFGLSSIRFFECLAFGRIPIWISNQGKLPLENKINYDDFIIRVDENDLENIPDKIRNFQSQKNLIQVSNKCREIYETWFAPNKFDLFMEAALFDCE